MERTFTSLKFDGDSRQPQETRGASRCSICGEHFETPLYAVVSSGYLKDEYYACPRCLSKVHGFERPKRLLQVEEAEEEAEEAVEAVAEAAEVEMTAEPELPEEPEAEVKAAEEESAPEEAAGCMHSLGYLKRRPKDAPIPEECFVCPKMIDCMAH
jgi:DNA-directed RNA polymerase subunit RPC12/RpoP